MESGLRLLTYLASLNPYLGSCGGEKVSRLAERRPMTKRGLKKRLTRTSPSMISPSSWVPPMQQSRMLQRPIENIAQKQEIEAQAEV